MNPYLTILAILTAGLLGFESNKQLTILDPKKSMLLPCDASVVGEFGIREKMPKSLKESLTILKNDQELVAALGPEIIDRYLKLKGKEEENFKKLTAEERKVLSMSLF